LFWVVVVVKVSVSELLLAIQKMATDKVLSYKDLEIYQIATELAIKIYKKSLELPQHDKYETGSQIRRSSQGIKDTLVEGYGRRKYKNDFIKFLVYAHASALEALSQAEFLDQVHPYEDWDKIAMELDKLGSKIHNFITYVENHWRT
jgi:four helix bundle protein